MTSTDPTMLARNRIAALASCRFLPGSAQKRFVRSMAAALSANPHLEPTPRQQAYLEDLAWHFRRQIPADLVPITKPASLWAPNAA